jgi:hypothetical protein
MNKPALLAEPASHFNHNNADDGELASDMTNRAAFSELLQLFCSPPVLKPLHE